MSWWDNFLGWEGSAKSGKDWPEWGGGLAEASSSSRSKALCKSETLLGNAVPPDTGKHKIGLP